MRWSKLCQILECRLCKSLQGRVRYFATRYCHAHDGQGRVCVLVDGKERLNLPFSVEVEKSTEAHRRCAHTEKSFREIFCEVEKDFAYEGRFEPGDFQEALVEYLQSSIGESLRSPNPLVRMFAIMDGRVGKRRLQVERETLWQQPEWLQFFYCLRLESGRDTINRCINR